jgi:hypothetical protein
MEESVFLEFCLVRYSEYRIYWHISPLMWPVRDKCPLSGEAYSKGIDYSRWSVRHTQFATNLRQEGAYKPGGLIAKGGLIC